MRVRYLATFAASLALILGACTAADGAKGPTGVQGEVGEKGPIGDPGPNGTSGATGDKGPTGDDGAKGPTGDDGAKGETGDTGAAGVDAVCADAEPLVITGTTGLPDYILNGTDSPEFTIDVETESGAAVTAGLDFTWVSAGPDLIEGSADNAFTVPTDADGSWSYDVWVTDGCHVARGSFAVSVETFTAHVAAVDVSQKAGALAIRPAGDDGSNTLFELTFLDATTHAPVDVSSVQLEVAAEGLSAVMTLPEMTFEHGGWYTLVVYDDAAGDTQVTLIEDVFAALSDPTDAVGFVGFNAAPSLGSFDLVHGMGAETLFADLPLGALTANAAEAALGDVLIGVDQLGDDSVEFGYHFSAGATDLIVPGETGTLFVVDNNDGGTNLPFLFVRTANPETGATYAAALAVDPLTLQYDVVVGEGSLAPTAPAALALPIESGSLVYTRTLDVTGCATVDSLVVGVDIPHEYRNDLLIELTSPGGTKVTLNYSQFSSGADFVGAFVDGATGAGLYTPDEPLSNFAGGNGNGTWTLYVEDTYASGDDGTFNGWSLALMCTNN